MEFCGKRWNKGAGSRVRCQILIVALRATGFASARVAVLENSARLIHESVGWNEQTPRQPELRPFFLDHVIDRTRCHPSAFALFRQHVARPCSGRHEQSEQALAEPVARSGLAVKGH